MASAGLLSLVLVFGFLTTRPGPRDLFRWTTGQALFSYDETGGRITLYPALYRFNPHTGTVLRPITPAVVARYKQQHEVLLMQQDRLRAPEESLRAERAKNRTLQEGLRERDAALRACSARVEAGDDTWLSGFTLDPPWIEDAPVTLWVVGVHVTTDSTILVADTLLFPDQERPGVLLYPDGTIWWRVSARGKPERWERSDERVRATLQDVYGRHYPLRVAQRVSWSGELNGFDAGLCTKLLSELRQLRAVGMTIQPGRRYRVQLVFDRLRTYAPQFSLTMPGFNRPLTIKLP